MATVDSITIPPGADVRIDFTGPDGEDMTTWTAAEMRFANDRSKTGTVTANPAYVYAITVDTASTAHLDLTPAQTLALAAAKLIRCDIWRTDSGEKAPRKQLNVVYEPVIL